MDMGLHLTKAAPIREEGVEHPPLCDPVQIGEFECQAIGHTGPTIDLRAVRLVRHAGQLRPVAGQEEFPEQSAGHRPSRNRCGLIGWSRYESGLVDSAIL